MELWFGRLVWLSGLAEGDGDRVVVTTDRKKIIISPSPAIA